MRKFIPSDPRIAKYEPLVRDRARRFWRGLVRRRWSLEDLQAMGRSAIWDAILTWRVDGGAAFGTYVQHVVMHAFLGAQKLAYERMRQGYTESLTNDQDAQTDLPANDQQPGEKIDGFRMRQAVRDAVDSLDPRQKEVVERRFWRDETLEQVGSALGVTRERARQLEEKAFHSLRPRLVFLRPIGLSNEARAHRVKQEKRSQWAYGAKQRAQDRAQRSA